MRTIFIVNRNAKNTYSLHIWERLEKKLDAGCEVFKTASSYEVAEIINRERKENPKSPLYIIGVGGDGTISSVINNVIGQKNMYVGYIPAGSGNDFARGFTLPQNGKEAFEWVKHCQNKGSVKSFDTGFFQLKEGRNGYFVNNMGIGLDALIAEKANSSKWKKCLNKWSLGKLVYPFILLKEIIGFKRFSLNVTIDEKKTSTFSNVWFLTVANQQYFGGGMKIAPNADPADGELDIIIVSGLAKWKLLLLFLSVFQGKHTSIKGVSILKGKAVKIQSNANMPVHSDGDLIGEAVANKGLNITVKPNSFQMIKRIG